MIQGQELSSSNHVYRFYFEAAAGTTYPIQSSLDLLNWTLLTNAVGAGGPLWIEDPDNTNGARFYHVGIATKPKPIPPTPIANMVFIAAGSFLMGSPDSEPDRDANEGPQTLVTLSRGFWMGKYEVTQGDYGPLMGTAQSIFTWGPQMPVDFASWVDATNYCQKLTDREIAAGHLPAGYRYRLPTEAEWEYACRAGTTTAVSVGTGTNLSSVYANFDGTFPYNGAPTNTFYNHTAAGGLYPPNAWGLCDMLGNVAEWCQDIFAPYPGGAVNDPQGGTTGTNRPLRGGGYESAGRGCRSAKRVSRSQTFRDFGQGFRVVLAADPTP
jgi:formylglycine-generating enzyme required for sulfatase activity